MIKKPKAFLQPPERLSRDFIESLKIGVYMADVNGNLVFANQAYAQILGYKNSKDIIGLNLARELYTNSKDRGIFLNDMKEHGFVRDYEIQNKRKGGTAVILSVTSSFTKDAEGHTIGTEGVIRDITEKKRTQEELKRLQESLQLEKQKLEQVLNIDQKISSILELNHLVDFVIDGATRILEAKRCSLMLLDHETQELLIKGAKGLDKKIVKSTRVKVGEQISGAVAKLGEPLLVNDIETFSIFPRKNRPSCKSKSFLCVPIKLHNRLVGVVNVTDKDSSNGNTFTMVDLKILCSIVRQAAIAIENANYYRELEFLSTSDSLTGLFNHRYFVTSLDREINRLKRYSKPLCLLMTDIDHFKVCNDTYGHLEGDHLLKNISKLLKQNLRSVDILCRYAGDEFVVILPETDVPQAKIVAEKISHAMSNATFKCKVTLSIGIAKYTEHMDRLGFVMKTDQALYQAKREGGNRICCFD